MLSHNIQYVKYNLAETEAHIYTDTIQKAENVLLNVTAIISFLKIHIQRPGERSCYQHAVYPAYKPIQYFVYLKTTSSLQFCTLYVWAGAKGFYDSFLYGKERWNNYY